MTLTMTMKKCQECKQHAALYHCPRCSRKTCSLACCIRHKKHSGCTGKRDRTTFQRLEEMNDAALQSDFHFLEDVLRHVDGSKRVLKQVGAAGRMPVDQTTMTHPMLLSASQPKEEEEEDALVDPTLEEEQSIMRKRRMQDNMMPPKWRRLVQLALEQGTTILLMPSGMERHKSNTSFQNTKSYSLHWKVEFVCHFEKTRILLTCNKLPDTMTPIAELGRLLQVNGYVDIDIQDIHLLLKKLPCPSNQPRYVRITIDQTLKEALTGMTVIEYPTFEVVLTKDLDKYPLIISEVLADHEHQNDDTATLVT